MSFSYVAATQGHVEALIPWVRSDDLVELAAVDMTAREALELGLAVSFECWAALLDGEVACVWGVAPGFEAGKPAAWMLTGHLVEVRPIAFFKECRREVSRLLERYGVLCNFVDARYTRALEWARRLGFVVGPAEPYGPHNLPHHSICIRKESQPCVLPLS